MKRVMSANRDLIATVQPAQPSTEQFALFRRYLDDRHQHGGMSDMSALDYAIMVEDTHVNTRLIEYRIREPGSGLSKQPQGELIAVALTDMMSDGLSMVYSFFNPKYEKRSLGTFMILDHINRARSLGLPHVYLGYWVKGSPKMDYKTRYQPQEQLMARGWERSLPPAADSDD
jgi:arginine-tRNA-protein transferase